MRKVSVDTSREKGTFSYSLKKCVGVGRAAELLRYHVIEQLRMAKADCGFEYLRFHGIFSEDINIYNEDEKGNAFYNWQYLDLVFDSLIELGYRPFVELSFMPEQISRGDKEIFWWHANVCMPSDESKWIDLIKATVMHFQERYTKEEVKHWFFEVWNEPNYKGFFDGTMLEYFRLYEITSAAIKSIDNEYQVGGPASAGNEWVPDFIDYCVSHHLPLDFISTHVYGVDGAFDSDGNSKLYMKTDMNCIANEIKEVKSQIMQSPVPELPLHYTEWGSSYSPNDPIHDSYIQASYNLYHLKRVQNLVDSIAYWDISDIIEEDGPSKVPFHGGFGLVNIQSIKKPGYIAYQFLNQLGEIEIEHEDSDSFVCKSEDGYQILIWNYKKINQSSDNKSYFNQILVPNKEQAEEIELVLSGLLPGQYQVKEYKVGFMENDAYTIYLKNNRKNWLTREEASALKKQCDGAPYRESQVVISEDGMYTRKDTLQEYDCLLVVLKKG